MLVLDNINQGICLILISQILNFMHVFQRSNYSFLFYIIGYTALVNWCSSSAVAKLFN